MTKGERHGGVCVGGGTGVLHPTLLDKLSIWTKKQQAQIALCSLSIYFILGFIVAFNNFEMHILVWIYAIRGLCLIFGAINMPLLPIGRKTGYRYSFWLFAVHFWLDGYVSGFVGKYLSGVVSQAIVWLVVVTVGLAFGMCIQKISPRLFRVFTGVEGDSNKH